MKNNKWNMSNAITRNALRSFLILFLVCLVLLSRNTTALADNDYTWLPAMTTSKIRVTARCPSTSDQYEIHILTNNTYEQTTGALACSVYLSIDATITDGKSTTLSLKPVGNNCPQSLACTWEIDNARRTETIDCTADYYFSYSCPTPTPSPTPSSMLATPMPEDENGAYYLEDGQRYYAWFHDRETCLNFLGNPDLCVWPRVRN